MFNRVLVAGLLWLLGFSFFYVSRFTFARVFLMAGVFGSWAAAAAYTFGIARTTRSTLAAAVVGILVWLVLFLVSPGVLM